MTAARALEPMTPERETDGALSRLVDVLLDKGVHLDLELLVTVAEVPLIAVHLRAMIAGVETMIEHGVPGVWTDSVAAARAAAPEDRGLERQEDNDVVRRAPARREELRDGGAVWRDGTLELDTAGVLRWRGSGDRRPSLALASTRIAGVSVGSRTAEGLPVLSLRTDSGEERLALEEATDWVALLDGGSWRIESADRGGRA